MKKTALKSRKHRANFITITSSELNRVRVGLHVCRIEFFLQEDSQSRDHIPILGETERRELGEERKRRMRAIDAAKKRGDEPPSFDDIQANLVCDRARLALDEELDSVKHMNQLIAFAKVQTIRDIQIEEKRLIEKEALEDAQRVDAMMEAERVSVLAAGAAAEKQRLLDQRKGAEILRMQIVAREKEKQAELALVAKERLHMLSQIEKDARLSEQQQVEKKMVQARLMEEIANINAKTTEAKEREILMDKLEDCKLLEYQRIQDLKAKTRLEDAKNLAEKREMELSILRARQEKNLDKTEQIDALRAKRAIEAAERLAREKELADRARVSAIQAELTHARQVQQAERRLKLVEQVLINKAEFDAMIDYQLQQETSEKFATKNRQNQVLKYTQSIRFQIEESHDRTVQQREALLQEGDNLRRNLHNEKIRLNEIKIRKIDQVTKAGVDEKHTLRLLKYQP